MGMAHTWEGVSLSIWGGSKSGKGCISTAALMGLMLFPEPRIQEQLGRGDDNPLQKPFKNNSKNPNQIQEKKIPNIHTYIDRETWLLEMKQWVGW